MNFIFFSYLKIINNLSDNPRDAVGEYQKACGPMKFIFFTGEIVDILFCQPKLGMRYMDS
jgi:hypothetical protein